MRLSKKTFSILFSSSFFIGLIIQLIFTFNIYSGSFLSKYLNFTIIIPLYISSLICSLNFIKIRNKFFITIISMVFAVIFGELAMIIHPIIGGPHTQMYGIVFFVVIPPAIIFGLIYGIIISLLLDKY